MSVRPPKPATARAGATRALHQAGTAGATYDGASQLKRTLTSDNLLATTANLVSSLPVLLPAFVRPATSATLREKVFLGVTSVNECRYCKWLHTRLSLNQGVTLKEVQQILDRQVQSSSAKGAAEAAAVRYGRSYAEHLDRVDANAAAALRQYYSKDQVDEILAYVRFITFANLLGNTADAFLDRLLVTVVGAAATPFAVFMHLAAKLDREIDMDPPSSWRRARPDGAASLP